MLEKRSFSLSKHRTSIALEPEFWVALKSFAKQDGLSLAGFVARIDAVRGAEQKLASALRVAVLARLTN